MKLSELKVGQSAKVLKLKHIKDYLIFFIVTSFSAKDPT